MLEEPFLGAIVARASEAGEVEEDGRGFGGGGLGWEVEIDFHLAGGGSGFVGQLEQLAAEAGDGCRCFEGHGWNTFRIMLVKY